MRIGPPDIALLFTGLSLLGQSMGTNDGSKIRPTSRFIVGCLYWITCASRTLLPQFSCLPSIFATLQLMVDADLDMHGDSIRRINPCSWQSIFALPRGLSASSQSLQHTNISCEAWTLQARHKEHIEAMQRVLWRIEVFPDWIEWGMWISGADWNWTQWRSGSRTRSEG